MDPVISCVQTRIQEQPMRVIRNLIEVKITDEQLSKANFEDGLNIQVRCEKPFIVNAFWIVKIGDIHKELDKDWLTIRNELWDNKFLSDNGKSLFQNKPMIHQESNVQVECTIKPPEIVDTTKLDNVTPRDFYPLVIIVCCYEEEAKPQATDAAANIHLVHIKDSIVPIKSHVIKQYMKQIDGRILDISQLYAEDGAACFICFEEASLEEGLKLFCLLPCRHSPICSNCINRIRECPKCRCPIATMFDINAPIAAQQQQQQAGLGASSSQNSTIDPNLRHLYDDANSDSTAQNNGRQKSGFLATLKSYWPLK